MKCDTDNLDDDIIVIKDGNKRTPPIHTPVNPEKKNLPAIANNSCMFPIMLLEPMHLITM